MLKVIVFGASGLLGASLVPYLRRLEYTVLTQGRTASADLVIDPTDRKVISTILKKEAPIAIVNLIAATNVDRCEGDPELASIANVEVVAAITEAILAVRDEGYPLPHLVHISTDQIYSGSGPHSEISAHPINVYGLSKYAGELYASKVNSTILRTNFYGKSKCSGRVSFSDWIVQNLRRKTPITVFNDVMFSAVHLNTLCNLIADCIDKRPVGLFNFGCRDAISKADFALNLANELNFQTDNLQIGSSSDVVLNARRPFDMSLNVANIESALNMKCPTMLDEIKQTAKEYMND